MSIFEDDKKKEEDIIKRAFKSKIPKINKTQTQKEIHAYQFFTIPDLLRTVRFQQPTVCYVQVVNCDKLTVEGFPTQSIHEVSKPHVVATKRRYKVHGEKTETVDIGKLTLHCDLAIATIKNQTYTIKYTEVYAYVPAKDILYQGSW